ncbi:thiamine phosphate synthase [Frigoribacterium sp. RIT-PI-h]|uniref:thiamine phosphate synthase n=1 Tax=Frigoribacterium sp. RIT-PI-h TaxID=1690245 RepID=UPI0006B983DD|nr:thiamine phosphate synthase [Frigoribacterium sp. RIT-PI-h]KPG82346.1 hypothetical protein AEQ27_09515 [Frigoribacterium sp. RIT-PI-h]
MTPDLSLYLVTDTVIARRAGHQLPDLVAAAVDGGVSAVQIREKDSPAGQFLDLVAAISEVTPIHVPVLVNDRVDVFLAARARGIRVSGVNVGQSDLPADVVRDLIGPEALLGVSASTPSRIEQAAQHADYVGIGPVWLTNTKPDAENALGVDRLAELAAQSPVPVVAIGGIGHDQIAELCGKTAGVAIVSSICGDPDPRRAARRLAEAWTGRS